MKMLFSMTKQLLLASLFFILFLALFVFIFIHHTIIVTAIALPILIWLSWQASKLCAILPVLNQTLRISGKSVFITGCDSGFGHKLALRLHALGCDVFAGCLFPDGEGAISLSKYQSERLKVVKLDVTKDEDVFAAVNYVTNNLRNNSLWALVNNAGVVHYAATEFGENGIGVFDETMRVNALGTVRVTKAFLPLLRKEKGSRAIFLSSIAGRVEFPTLTAYSMSKFAVNAFCNSLRREMKRFHVYVSIIEPTVYKTAMGDKKIILEDFRRIWEKTSDEVKEDYGHDGYRKNHDYVEALMDTRISNCDDVVDAIVEAIRRKEPRCVYRVGSFVVRATIEASTYFAEEFSDIVYSHHISMITLKLIAFVHRVLRI